MIFFAILLSKKTLSDKNRTPRRTTCISFSWSFPLLQNGSKWGSSEKNWWIRIHKWYIYLRLAKIYGKYTIHRLFGVRLRHFFQFFAPLLRCFRVMFFVTFKVHGVTLHQWDGAHAAKSPVKYSDHWWHWSLEFLVWSFLSPCEYLCLCYVFETVFGVDEIVLTNYSSSLQIGT